MKNKICSMFRNPVTGFGLWFYKGKVINPLKTDLFNIRFDIRSEAPPRYHIYLSYKGRDLPGLLSGCDIDVGGWHVINQHKNLAKWCIKNRDITKPLFKKYNVRYFSIITSFTKYGECIDRKWMYLLDDIIQHSEFIRTELL